MADAYDEEMAAVFRDAARYRWLRSDDIEVPQGQREIVVQLLRLPFREDQSDETLTESELDAAVDAARGVSRMEDETGEPKK